MPATILDGKAAARAIRDQVRTQVAELADSGIVPGLAVVLVGNDPASHVYVRNKVSQTVEVGMRSFEHRLPAHVEQADLMSLIGRLNADPLVHGILVQLPLPRHIDGQAVLNAIDPAKDADGFHPVNAGSLASGLPGLVPCTPLGCVHLVRMTIPNLEGRNAVVVGRSNIVGKPVAQLLLNENCTVTVAHSRTCDLPALCRQADILVAAVGRPRMIRGDWIKSGAIVIDVGINRLPTEQGGGLVGDVAFEEALERAEALTPVPGGVGPMTIAYLLVNTLKIAKGHAVART